MTQTNTSGKVPRIMLMIRLQRVGRKNHAEFRVVVTEKTRAPKSSNYVELLGHYNPHTNEVKFNEERVKHWMSVGAKVSDTVHNLLVRENIIKGKKINVLPRKTPIIKDEETKDSEEKSEDGVENSNKEVDNTTKEEKETENKAGGETEKTEEKEDTKDE